MEWRPILIGGVSWAI